MSRWDAPQENASPRQSASDAKAPKNPPVFPRPMGHLALYGHVNIDWIVRLPEPPHKNGTVELRDRELRYGGTAGNIAAVAANLGAQVKLGGFVGSDFPDHYRVHLANLGVDCTDLHKKDAYGTPTWWGFIDPDHNVYGVLDQGPFRDMHKFEVLTRPLEDAAMVHFSTGRPAYYERVAEHAKQKGVEIMLDPGQELRALYDPDQLERFLELADHFIVNHVEMEQALDKMGYGDPVQLFDHNLKSIIHTAGSDGAWLLTENEKVHIPVHAVPPDKVVDTTGAGDAFRGALHAARQRGKDLVTACRWGAAAAAINVQHIGGQAHLPRSDEIEALVEAAD